MKIALCAAFASALVLAAAATVDASVPPTPAELFSRSGFLTVNATSGVRLMHYFWPAQTGTSPDPASTPLILWLQGGPGAAAVMGFMSENGPYGIDGSERLAANPYAWTTKYHMLYIDSPRGTGYSETGTAGYVTTEAEMADDLFAALAAFYAQPGNEALAACPFFLMGESYAGKYIPSLVEVLRSKSPVAGFDLAGLAVGNGLVDPVTQVTAYADFAYALQLANENQRDALKAQQDECVALIEKEEWVAASNLWNQITVNMLQEAGWPDPGDVRYYGFSELNFTASTDYVTSGAARAALGVSPTANFTLLDAGVANALSGDEMKSVVNLVGGFLNDTDLGVMFFTGNFDPALPVPEKWVRNIPWHGQGAFRAAKRAIWTDSLGDTAGYVTEAGNLRFVVVVQAGHMAVRAQPMRTLEMVEAFVTATLARRGS